MGFLYILNMIIYKITNILNNKVYIGQTSRTLYRRKKEHIKRSLDLKYKTKLYNAIRKYGIDNFKFETIDTASDKIELNKKEENYIIKYNSLDINYGYNIQKGSYYTKNPSFGNKKEYYFKKGQVAHNKGIKGLHKMEEESKIKMRNSSPKNKFVYMYDFNLNLINRFQSMRDCSRILGDMTAAVLFKMIKNNNIITKNKYKGFYFTYIENNIPSNLEEYKIKLNLINDYINGLTLKELKSKYGIPNSTFYRWIEETKWDNKK